MIYLPVRACSTSAQDLLYRWDKKKVIHLHVSRMFEETGLFLCNCLRLVILSKNRKYYIHYNIVSSKLIFN